MAESHSYLTANNFTHSYDRFNFHEAANFIPNIEDGFAFHTSSYAEGYIQKILPVEGGTWRVTYGSQYTMYDPVEIVIDNVVVDSTIEQVKSFTFTFSGGETFKVREIYGGAIIYNIAEITANSSGEISSEHNQKLLAHFDGSVANNELVDIKNGTYNATYKGTSPLITATDTLYGDYVVFNGTDQYYELTTGFTSAQITDKITFSCLIRPKSSTRDWQGIFTNTPGSNTGLSFALNYHYKYWFQIYPGTHTHNLEGGYTLNEWHVFSVVYDGSTVKAYKDLTELIVKNQTGNITFFDTTPWYIGVWHHYSVGKFKGDLARMMIFNDAIPINDLYTYMT